MKRWRNSSLQFWFFSKSFNVSTGLELIMTIEQPLGYVLKFTLRKSNSKKCFHFLIFKLLESFLIAQLIITGCTFGLRFGCIKGLHGPRPLCLAFMCLLALALALAPSFICVCLPTIITLRGTLFKLVDLYYYYIFLFPLPLSSKKNYSYIIKLENTQIPSIKCQ